MSLSRRNFLLASAASAALGPRAARAATAPSGAAPEFMIVCIAKGGWDPLFVFDPKPGNDYVDGPEVDYPGSEYQKMFWDNQYIQCNDDVRKSVGAFFETWGDRAAVLNGVWMGSIVHQPCRIRLLTGTPFSHKPDFATIFGFHKGVEEPIGSIDFSGLGYAGDLAASTGRVGEKSQLKALLDPESMFPAPTWADYDLPLFKPTEDEEWAIRNVIEQRADKFRQLRADGGVNDQRVSDLFASLDRRERLQANGEAIVEPLFLGGEPSFEMQADLAVQLISQGLCRAVTLQHFVSWDTHKMNILQHGNYNDFFTTINKLLNNLQEQGLLDRTLVTVISEMGRTPRRNLGLGKDHWMHGSQLLIGAGVAGGRTYGATDDMVESMKVDYATGEPTGGAQDETAPGALIRYDNLAAGILQHMGIDSEPYFPTIEPFTAFSTVV